MKITIYELLGLVKDGKAPKKIKYDYNVYVYDEKYEDYYCEDKGFYLLGKTICDDGWKVSFALNINVEILEEQKKIPEKLPYYSLEKIQKAKNKDEWREERISLLEKRGEDLHIKINEILDFLKQN